MAEILLKTCEFKKIYCAIRQNHNKNIGGGVKS